MRKKFQPEFSFFYLNKKTFDDKRNEIARFLYPESFILYSVAPGRSRDEELNRSTA